MGEDREESTGKNGYALRLSHSHGHSLTKNVTTADRVQHRFNALRKAAAQNVKKKKEMRKVSTVRKAAVENVKKKQKRYHNTKECSRCKKRLELSSFDTKWDGTFNKACRKCLQRNRINQKRSRRKNCAEEVPVDDRHTKRLRRTVENICDQVRAQFYNAGVQALVKCESTPGEIPSIRINISIFAHKVYCKNIYLLKLNFLTSSQRTLFSSRKKSVSQ